MLGGERRSGGVTQEEQWGGANGEVGRVAGQDERQAGRAEARRGGAPWNKW